MVLCWDLWYHLQFGVSVVSTLYTPSKAKAIFICGSFVGCYIWMLHFEHAGKISRFRKYIGPYVYVFSLKYKISHNFPTLSARGSSLYIQIWRLHILTYRNGPALIKILCFIMAVDAQHRYNQINRKELTKTFSYDFKLTNHFSFHGLCKNISAL